MESRFRRCGGSVPGTQNDLEQAIELYTSVAANTTSVDEITPMTAMMDVVFDNLQSPLEKEVSRFMQHNGGIERVLEASELKKQLFESWPKDEKGLSMPMTQAGFDHELAKDAKIVMEENKDAFERRFSEANALQRERIKWNHDRAIHGMFVRMHAGIHGDNRQGALYRFSMRLRLC